jgi:hypothetical protein
MNTRTQNTPQGVWGRRPGYTQDTFIHSDTAGTEDLTVDFSHDSETGVPTLRMNGMDAVHLVINGRKLPIPSEGQLGDMRDVLAELEVAAEGGSNDEEIEALRAALDRALNMLGLVRE